MNDFTKAEFWKEHAANNGDRAANTALHRKYYGQFVTPAVIDTVVRFIGRDVILNSTNKDGCFNDIPLLRWDKLSGLIGAMCNGHIRRCNGSGGVSLSDHVCVAKEAAKQWRELELAKQAGG